MLIHSRQPHEPRRGVILLAVLIVIVILSLAAYTYNDLILSEYRAADTYARSSLVRAAADSGVAYTMGLLCDSNAYGSAPLDYNPWNNPAAFQDVVVNKDDNPRKSTKFSIISLCSDTNPYNEPFSYLGTPYRFGVQDESAKLNINVIMTNPTSDTNRINMLMGQSPNGLQFHYYPMTTNMANYLLDWMDPNPTSTRDPGAKDTTYMGFPKPYHCKNGPFDTLEEMLLVNTMQPQMMFGNDRNRNGTTLDIDQDGNPPNQGWSSFLTVYSHEPNVDVNNRPRINVNDTNLQTLNTNLTNLSNPGASTLAQFVLAYRLYGGSSITPTAPGAAANAASGTTPPPTAAAPMPPDPPAMSAADLTSIQTKISTDLANAGTSSSKNQITSLTSLVTSKVTVTIPGTSGRPGDSKSITYYSPLAYSANQAQLLPILYDELTFTNAADLTPRINVNTASQVVLNMFTQLAPAEIQSIANYQPINESQAGNLQNQNANGAQSNPYNTIGWLITVAGIAPSRVQQIEPYITARSRIYRFQSIGYCDSGTPVCRLEVVVDTSGWSMTPGGIPQGRPRIVYRRDISELGSGNFDFLPKPGR